MDSLTLKRVEATNRYLEFSSGLSSLKPKYKPEMGKKCFLDSIPIILGIDFHCRFHIIFNINTLAKPFTISIFFDIDIGFLNQYQYSTNALLNIKIKKY